MEFGVNEILLLVSGLALFLLGMNSMGDGLEKACGNKMKMILEKLTKNRFIGVLVGMGITMVVQSSSLTTVMVVGFVNAGMMTLTQAVWIIMGANIGTTITAQLIALNVSGIAPLFAIIGVIMIVFIKKPTINEIGKIFCGFGVLFIGMDLMKNAMMPLRDNEAFINLMTTFSNPIIGILVGALFTALVQSSSVSIGILQALAISGTIGLDSAVYVLFGQNIGTCITAFLASAGTNRNAKRTTLIHLIFNLTGTVIFTLICYFTPLTDLLASLTISVEKQIANMHTLFNVTTTIVLLPLGSLLVRISEKLLPDKQQSRESIFMYLSNDMNVTIGSTAIHLENTKLEIKRMYDLAYNNINGAFDALLNNENINKDLEVNEDIIDKLNEGITKEITKILTHETSVSVNKAYSSYLNVSHNIERLSDHAMNLLDWAVEFKEKNIVLNEVVIEEIKQMKDLCIKMLDKAMDKMNYQIISDYETITDEKTKEFKVNMIDRLKASICTPEGSMIYSNVLVDFERIGDHLLNITENMISIG